MAGKTLKELGVIGEIEPSHIAVKESVFPFVKFPGVDTILGPEMKSTGEVMGIDRDFARAFAKAQLGAGVRLPLSGTVFISVRDSDKKHIVTPAKNLYDIGFELVATRGTATYLAEKGIPVRVVNKVAEGRPHIVEAIKNNEIAMVINTTHGAQAVADSFSIRRNALINNIAYFTTTAGARAAVVVFMLPACIAYVAFGSSMGALLLKGNIKGLIIGIIVASIAMLLPFALKPLVKKVSSPKDIN